MTLEQQVTSLELSKKLKELGYPQRGLFCWIEGCLMSTYDYSTMIMDFVAPTVAELGEKLPKKWHTIKIDRARWIGGLDPMDNEMREKYRDYGAVEAQTEADARAKMLIRLLENKWFSFDNK